MHMRPPSMPEDTPRRMFVDDFPVDLRQQIDEIAGETRMSMRVTVINLLREAIAARKLATR